MKKMTYEQALEKLQQTVNAMESGTVSLDESVKLYEEGTKLAVYCMKCLETAKQKITDISNYTGEEDDD
ncbi:MAG: exodeoxyribonuclease VII small subunit [Clostridia bacterium]|nr:exodeoxyribonuclease VII small subunit [Clostridia bacterium]